MIPPKISQAQLDRLFAIFVKHAIAGTRCPTGPNLPNNSSGVARELARRERILIEVSGTNWRQITILDGPHAGKRTAPESEGPAALSGDRKRRSASWRNLCAPGKDMAVIVPPGARPAPAKPKEVFTDDQRVLVIKPPLKIGGEPSLSIEYGAHRAAIEKGREPEGVKRIAIPAAWKGTLKDIVQHWRNAPKSTTKG